MINFTKVEGSDKGEIRIYALSTCGWCRRAKQFMGKQEISYCFIEVDLLEGEDYKECMEELKKINPNKSFPTISINGQVVIGYDEEKLNKALNDK